jgi:antitoxin CptB
MERGALNRLRWRCTRRAMLEMDLLLGKFLDERFSTLSPDQAAAFVVLADMEDLELWPLVNGARESEDLAQAQVVAMLHEVRVS